LKLGSTWSIGAGAAHPPGSSYDMGYKDPAFQDRLKSAADAKQKALDKLKAKPPVDEAVLAERKAAAEAKAAAQAEKRAAKQAEKDREEAERAAQRAEAEASAVAAPTPEELKAARDARYAARKQKRK
jgi:hypothetical protein